MALDSAPESNLVNFEDDDLYDPVFIFVTEREHNFQKSENIAFTLHLERKKKNLSELKQVFFGSCLSCLNTSKQK